MTAEKYWQFTIKEVVVGNEVINTGWTAISSTGNPFIALAKPLLDRVIAISGASFDKRNDIWKVDCNTNFKLSFKFDEVYYTITADKLIYSLGKGGCQFLVKEATDPNFQIVLGSPFNQAVCIVYDYSGQIGLAESY